MTGNPLYLMAGGLEHLKIIFSIILGMSSSQLTGTMVSCGFSLASLRETVAGCRRPWGILSPGSVVEVFKGGGTKD